MHKPISEKEVNLASRLAKRKAGVTVKQLADKLKATPRRARLVLKRVPDVKTSHKGAKAGQASRTLVYQA